VLNSSYTIRQKIGLLIGIPVFILFIFLPRPEGMSQNAHYVACTTALMAIWWLSEAIPIPVTSLLPLILFPFFGVMSAADTASNYSNRIIFLFLGGFFIATAIEKSGLHKRIALNIIALLGRNRRTIILGFMIATSSLSMWISDTATTLMMLPIGAAVISALNDIFQDVHESRMNFNRALMLGIAYASSIGGIGTMIGTPPNLIFGGMSRTLFPDAPEITFTKWMSFGLIIVVIFSPLTWFILTRFLFKVEKKNLQEVKSVVRQRLLALGKMRREEKFILTIFTLTALGWIFRQRIDIDIFYIPGWSELLKKPDLIHDSTVAIAGALLLFIISSDWKQKKFLLSWEDAKNIPWGILILFGGGIALAAGFRESGLSLFIGQSLKGISQFPPVLAIFIICIVTTFLTEITSNTATSSILLPIIAGLAVSAGIHPYLLMIPATISASCAFMLPVATPSNAIVFSSGWIKIPHMAKSGIYLNIIGAVLITLITFLVIVPLFDISFGVLPSWAQ